MVAYYMSKAIKLKNNKKNYNYVSSDNVTTLVVVVLVKVQPSVDVGKVGIADFGPNAIHKAIVRPHTNPETDP